MAHTVRRQSPTAMARVPAPSGPFDFRHRHVTLDQTFIISLLLSPVSTLLPMPDVHVLMCIFIVVKS